MRLLLLLLLCISWLLLAPLIGAAEEDRSAVFTRIGDTNTIADGVVTALAQDPSGLLWIGTTRGLVRYDGYEFRRYTHHETDPRSLVGNLVRSLMVARDGRLWVGSDASGVSVYDARLDHFASFDLDPDGDPAFSAASVMALAEGNAGEIYIGTRGAGLLVLDPHSQSIRRFHDGQRGAAVPRSDVIHALTVAPDGRVWVGSYAGLGVLLEGASKITPLWQGDAALTGIQSDPVFSLEQIGGVLWVGTQGGRLLLYDPDTDKIERMHREVNTPPGMLDSIADIRAVPGGSVWLARTSGLEVRDERTGEMQRWMRHRPELARGLAANDVRALLLDRDQLLWTGGFGGGVQWHDLRRDWLQVLPGEPGHREVFARPNIAAICQRRNGEVWLGMRGDGIAVLDASLRLRRGYQATREGDSKLPVAWVTAIVEDAREHLWLGSRDGLLHLDPQTESFSRLGVAEGLSSLSVRRLHIDRHDDLWIGSSEGLFRTESSEAKTVLRVPRADGTALSGEVNAFAEDQAGRLWVGGSSGLFFVENDALKALPLGSQTRSVVGLLVDRRGDLWVDTAEGSYRLRASDPSAMPELLQLSLPTEDGFGANLLDDDQGRIWTHRYAYTPATGELYALNREIGAEFGTGWFRAYAKLADGRMLFGGSRGLLVITPSRFTPRPFVASVFATELRVGERDLAPAAVGDRLVLSPAERSFSVQFAALDYTQSAALKYAYRLAGVDSDWVQVPSSQRVASYRNLSPGRYQLEVSVRDFSGSLSPNALRMQVEVAPRWWQRWVFQTVGVLLLMVLVGAAFRMRDRLLRQRARTLEALVTNRTQELELAKQRAEAALEHLHHAQDRLVQSEKLASLGRLVAGVAHEINSPIGIAVTAASHLQDINRKASAKLVAGDLTKGELRDWQLRMVDGQGLILSSLERAARLVSSFKRVAVDQSSEERRRFPLPEFMQQVHQTFAATMRRNRRELLITPAPEVNLDSYPGPLFQVISNLIENANTHAFAADAAGMVTIECEMVDSETLQIRCTDNGTGIPSDVRGKVFEPFFTTRRNEGGSGLGLHLVHNIVTGVLGGVIDLTSSRESGTTITLRLPLQAPHKPGL